jgi:hypothetical protein
MSLTYAIDAQKKHVRIIGEGPLVMPAMIAVVDQAAEDPRFSSSYSVIFDLTHAVYTAELSDGEAFVAALKRRLPDFQDKFALAVPPELHFLAQMYCVLAKVGGFDRMQCFTDLDEACRWCGV